MVATAPNRTRLLARVEGVRPHPTVDRWILFELVVLAADPVPSYRDMLHAEPGQRLDVAVDRGAVPAGADRPGTTVRVTATLAGPDVVGAVDDEPTVAVVSPPPGGAGPGPL